MLGQVDAIGKLFVTMRTNVKTRRSMLGSEMTIHGLSVGGPHVAYGALVHDPAQDGDLSHVLLDRVGRVRIQDDGGRICKIKDQGSNMILRMQDLLAK